MQACFSIAQRITDYFAEAGLTPGCWPLRREEVLLHGSASRCPVPGLQRAPPAPMAAGRKAWFARAGWCRQKAQRSAGVPAAVGRGVVLGCSVLPAPTLGQRLAAHCRRGRWAQRCFPSSCWWQLRKGVHLPWYQEAAGPSRVWLRSEFGLEAVQCYWWFLMLDRECEGHGKLVRSILVCITVPHFPCGKWGSKLGLFCVSFSLWCVSTFIISCSESSWSHSNLYHFFCPLLLFLFQH